MEIAFILSLVALALVDSTSVGTLVIPIWLLLVGVRLRARQLLLYIATIGLFYFGVGLLVLFGATSLAGSIDRLFMSKPVLWVQAALGLGMFIYAILPQPKNSRVQRRLERWHQEVREGALSSRKIVRLAIIAGLIELGTMLPYIAAIGLIVASDVSFGIQLTVLAGYTGIMILPALVLLTLRGVASQRLRPRLESISNWMTRNAEETLGWTFGIVGFLLARDAIARLMVPHLF